MLSVDNLGKTFKLRGKRGKKAATVKRDPREDGKQFHAVRGVSFTAETGAILGLLGPNGAGKTTLLRMLSTALVPTTGTADFDGVDIVKSPLDVRRKIGFLSGATGLYGRLSPREMVAYYGRLHGVAPEVLPQRIDEVFELLQMQSFADKRNDDLSAGMKQKTSIARTLVHDPEIIIFDEPTTGLDVAAAETIIALIERCREQNKTVLFSTHHMHEVERLCDHVVIVSEGEKVFEGNVDAMRREGGHEQLDRAFLGLVEAAA